MELNATEKMHIARLREDNLLKIYDLLQVRKEDRICIFDMCISDALSMARTYTEVALQLRSFPLKDKRLSYGLREARKRLVPLLSSMTFGETSTTKPLQSSMEFVALFTFMTSALSLTFLALGVCLGERLASGKQRRLGLSVNTKPEASVYSREGLDSRIESLDSPELIRTPRQM